LYGDDAAVLDPDAIENEVEEVMRPPNDPPPDEADKMTLTPTAVRTFRPQFSATHSSEVPKPGNSA
jgi:hypothetical protein